MWEEREIVRHLMDYHSSKKLTHQSKISVIKKGANRSLFFQFILKERYGRSSKKITKNTWKEWKDVRYILDECLEDDYIREEVRDGVEYLFLTAKGKKLARARYYYLKYLPEEFGDFKIVLLTIIGTIITSPIWKPIIESIGKIIPPWFK